MSTAWDCFRRSSDWVAHPVQAVRRRIKKNKKIIFLAGIFPGSPLIMQFIKTAKNYQDQGISCPPSLFALEAEDDLNGRLCPAQKQGRYAQKP
jgi:hypothetical protein